MKPKTLPENFKTSHFFLMKGHCCDLHLRAFESRKQPLNEKVEF